MRKAVVIVLFIIGISIFFYPIVSNLFATKEHHKMISDYNKKIEHLKSEEIQHQKDKVKTHNENLASSQTDFVDPFSNHNSSGAKSYYDALNISPAIGSVEIPKISVKLPIYHGTDEKILSRGVGHLENSSLPTGKDGTHTVLTAHRGLPSAKMFRDLDKIKIGDPFFVKVLDETLAYEVFDIKIVKPNETTWLTMHQNENIVTLLTCEPYMINTERLLVTGHRIPFEKKQAELIEDKSRSSYFYVLGAVVFTVILLIVWFIRKRKKLRWGSNEAK